MKAYMKEGYKLIHARVPRDQIKGAEAMKWFMKAAEQDYAPAQNMLGNIFRYGRYKVPRDFNKAFKWFAKAAELKFPIASNMSNSSRKAFLSSAKTVEDKSNEIIIMFFI